MCFLINVSFRAVVSALWAFLFSRYSSALYCFYCIVSVLMNKIFIHSFIQPYQRGWATGVAMVQYELPDLQGFRAPRSNRRQRKQRNHRNLTPPAVWCCPWWVRLSIHRSDPLCPLLSHFGYAILLSISILIFVFFLFSRFFSFFPCGTR